MDTSASALGVDLKLTYESIQRRFSCSSKRPSWKALSDQIKDRFGLGEDFKLGLSYIDDDGEAVVLSSDKELEHVWPVITEDDERDLDSLPPLRFTIVQLPASHSINAGIGNTGNRTIPSGDSVDTIVEDEMVDEVASGISDIDIIDGDDNDDDHENDGDKKKKKKKEPTKKRTTLQDDIRSFIDTVKGTVQDNEEIHKAFHKILAHIHHKPNHKKPDEGETGQEDDGGIIALAILTEETGKMDAVTAGIVSALLAPALMGPPPPPHPPFFPPHHGRRGHHHGGPPPPPPPPHFGRGKDGMPPPPPPPPHGFPPHHAPERGPSGRPPFPPPPPHFFSGRDADFFGMDGFEEPRFGTFKHAHGGLHYHGKGRGCPYGMPPFAGAPHMMRDGPFSGGRGGFPFGAAHHAPGPIFGRRGRYGKHEAAFEGPQFAFGGPHRHHQHHHHDRHARFFDGHPAGHPHRHHHMRGNWQESDNELPEHFGGMRMDEIDSDSDESSGASSSEEKDFPAFKKGRHGRFDGHSGAGQRGPPRPPHDRPRGPSEARKHHGEGPRGPLPYGKHGGPKHGDMPPPPPPPPHGPPRHHHAGRHHRGRWA